MTRTAVTAPLRLLLVGALLGACGGEPAPPPPAPRPVVQSPALGLRIAALPEPFEVEANEPERLVLAAPAGATVTFTLGPEEAYINLEEVVEERKAAFEELPGGEFKGRQQLVMPIGLAFTARGVYTGEQGPVEEMWVMLVHPWGDRRLDIVYRYPPGEGQERAQQLLGLLGELERLGQGS